MSAYAADSAEGRVLLALRAGAMTTAEMLERFPGGSPALADLSRQRLIAKDGDGYRITPAGRAACPFRNPLLAPKTVAPDEPVTTEETIMPKGIKQPFDQDAFMAVIRRAGADGITRRELVRCFSEVACERIVDRWIAQVVGAVPPLAYRPKHGVVAAVGAIATDLETKAEAAKIAREYNDFEFDLAPPAPEPETPEERAASDGFVDALVESAQRHGFVWEPKRPEATGAATDEPSRDALANPAETSGSPVSPNQQALSDDIIIVDPDMAEFALFSSGGLDIYYEDSTVSMTAPVLRKLRDFLGLFSEAA